MRKKIIFGSILVLILVLIGLFIFRQDEQVNLPTEGETVAVELTEKELATLQEKLHNEGYGFIYEVYALDAKRYLLYTKTRNIDYGEDFPADQLIWVEKTEEDMQLTVLNTGDYPVRLVMNQSHPYFIQNGEFYFVFYEAKGTKELPRKGKGYVYQVRKEKGVKNVYETTGDYHNFAMDKQNKMVVVERLELENRNLYPSFFAPYELYYQQYHKGKWTTIQQKKVEPDLQKAYEKYEEKQNKK